MPIVLSAVWDCMPLLQQLRALGPGSGFRRRALLSSCLAAFFDGDPLGKGQRSLRGEQRQRLQDLVDERLASGLDAEDIASHLGLSQDYCTRLFRGSFGCAPRRWLRDERIRQAAADLVEEGLSVAATAERWSYANATFFCRQFRQVLGCSPGEWRRRALISERS
jgi:AraC family transcriptional regulator